MSGCDKVWVCFTEAGFGTRRIEVPTSDNGNQVLGGIFAAALVLPRRYKMLLIIVLQTSPTVLNPQQCSPNSRSAAQDRRNSSQRVYGLLF
jgi:hypothetical protein